MISPKSEELIKKSRELFYYRRRIQLSNVPWDISIDSVPEKYIPGLSVESIHRNDRGFIHILLATPEDALKAVQHVNEEKAKDPESKVEAAVSQMDSLLFVGNLPIEFSEEDFCKMFESYGPIVRSWLVRSLHDGCSKGYGFVEFVHREDCGKAKESIPYSQVSPGRTIRVDFSSSNLREFEDCHSCSLFVDKLPQNVNRDYLYNVFVSHRPISFLQIAVNPQTGRSRNFAMVDCLNPEDAEYFWKVLDKTQLGNSEIRVYFSNPGRSAAVVMGGARRNNTSQDRKWGRAYSNPDGGMDRGIHMNHRFQRMGGPPTCDQHAVPNHSSVHPNMHYDRYPSPHPGMEYHPPGSSEMFHPSFPDPSFVPPPHGVMVEDQMTTDGRFTEYPFLSYNPHPSYPMATPSDPAFPIDQSTPFVPPVSHRANVNNPLPGTPGKIMVIDHSRMSNVPPSINNPHNQNFNISYHSSDPNANQVKVFDAPPSSAQTNIYPCSPKASSENLSCINPQKADPSKSTPGVPFPSSELHQYPQSNVSVGSSSAQMPGPGSSMYPPNLVSNPYSSMPVSQDFVHQYASQAASLAAWSMAVQMYNSQHQQMINSNPAMATAAAFQQQQMYGQYGSHSIRPMQTPVSAMANNNPLTNTWSIPSESSNSTKVANEISSQSKSQNQKTTHDSSVVSYSSCPVSYNNNNNNASQSNTMYPQQISANPMMYNNSSSSSSHHSSNGVSGPLTAAHFQFGTNSSQITAVPQSR